VSGKEVARRLDLIAEDPASIDAVCVTHEHGDHISSLGVLHRRYGMAMYTNHGTLEVLSSVSKMDGVPWSVFTTGERFVIGDLALEPFSVPHDSYDPVGFVIESGADRVGVVTDMGMATELIRQRLRGCRILAIEANHDVEMLRASQRPWSLKQRISGRQGHLSNAQAGELVAEVAGPGLEAVFLVHLSADCNEPGLARQAVEQALHEGGHGHVAVKLTYPDRPSEILTLGA
jgi:phosphoribosyl 1,2-cyclic phosphodiesterase